MKRFIRILPSELFILYILAGISLLFCKKYFVSLPNDNEQYVLFLKYTVVAVVLINVYFSIKTFRFEITHPYILFLGTFSLFLLS